MRGGLAALALAGCAAGWDVPGAELAPAADPAAGMPAAEWRGWVLDAASAWAAVLEPLGCPAPFVVADRGAPVRLVPASAWEHGDATAAIAHRGPDWIEVRAIPELPGGHPAYRRLLLHELGHAIGIGHLDGGLMDAHPRVDDLTPADVAAAAREMGCPEGS